MTRVKQRVAGAAVVMIVALSGAIVTARRAGGRDTLPAALSFSDGSGVLTTVTAGGGFDESNPFFAALGTNGRTCASCHRPAQAWSITPGELAARFERSGGLDPIFRTNDGSNCGGADLSTLEQRRRAFSLLISKGLIRISLDVPPGAEFEIVGVDDPYRCGSALARASMYRRPLPTANLGFLSAIMWDGRMSHLGHAVADDLVAQAADAIVSHAEGTAPAAAQLREIVEFELGVVAAQQRDRAAGTLNADGARGGVQTLARQPFCVGINDPLGMRPAMPGACLAVSRGLDPVVFTLFGAWHSAASPDRQAIARGEALFNTRQFVIDNVPGLNGNAGDPVSGPIATGTCTVCHDTPNAGNHSVAMALNIGITEPSRRTPDMPLYTLRNIATGEIVQSTDPGRAMVTGRWRDIGKFKGPILRGLAARPPYFHDGSAATLAEVIAFYDKRFGLQLSERDRADLLAFLQAL
jgi:hypothetical protein